MPEERRGTKASRVVGVAGWVVAGAGLAAQFVFWAFLLLTWAGWYSPENPVVAITVVFALGTTIWVLVSWLAVRRSASWRQAMAAWLVVGVLGLAGWVTWRWVESYEQPAVPEFEASTLETQ